MKVDRKIPFSHSVNRLCYPLMWAVILLSADGCTANKPYQVELMPAPEVYASGTVDPFSGIENIAAERVPYRGILYATDRRPAGEEGAFYENQRGFLLRLGLANIALGDNNLD